MLANSSAFATALAAAFETAVSFLESTESASVTTTVEVASLRAKLSRPLECGSLDAAQVIEELARDVEGGILGSSSGRFFAWVIGGSLPAALAADWLTSTWDQNAATYTCGPAAAIVEEVAGTWLKELLHLPASASFALVTGCQMAHVTCLAAARHALLAQRNWNVEERGLHGAPNIRIISSSNRHLSIDRAIRLLGLGTENLELLAPNDEERLDANCVRAALQRCGDTPAVLLLQAGDINTGAFDSFQTLIPIAKEYGAWVHVDGAFGLWAATSPRHRYLVEDVETADSWATDGHKWLNTPFDTGYAFVANPDAHRAAMSIRAPYITQHASARDQIDWNPEWSRRSRGFSTYAALRQLGRDGVADLVNRNVEHARRLVAGIGALDGAEILWHPIVNQGLVRFRDMRTNANEFDHDRRTEEVIECVNRSGEAFFGPTSWRGKRAMRVSVVNWQTTTEDVERAIASVQQALSFFI